MNIADADIGSLSEIKVKFTKYYQTSVFSTIMMIKPLCRTCGIGKACRFQTFRHLKEQFNCSCNIGWWKELDRQVLKDAWPPFCSSLYGNKHTKNTSCKKNVHTI